MTFSTLVLGDGALLIPCAEILLRRGHQIQAIVSTNGVIQEWAQEQKIHCVFRQEDLLSSVDGRPVDFLFSIANLSVIPARILGQDDWLIFGRTADGTEWRAGVTLNGRWCDVFEIRDFKIQRCFIYLDPDYAGLDTTRYPWLSGQA